MSLPFDEYVLKARIWPSFIVCSPVLIFGPIVASKVFNLLQTCIASSIISVALIALIGAVIRQLGVNQEEKLFKKWGGPPSTRFMHWRNNHWSKDHKSKLHNLVKYKFNISLSSEEEEDKYPIFADKAIESAFLILKNKLRGNKKYLAHQDNIDYGFSRNLYGAKWLWFFFSFASVTALILLPIIYDYEIPTLELACSIIYMIGIFFVEWIIMPKSVKHCASRYAESSWNELSNV